jgi:transaldolase
VLAALRDGASEDLIARELGQCKSKGLGVNDAVATLTVAVGEELSKLVPGRVSTEVDANLSFDTEASVQRGREIIAGPIVSIINIK